MTKEEMEKVKKEVEAGVMYIHEQLNLRMWELLSTDAKAEQLNLCMFELMSTDAKSYPVEDDDDFGDLIDKLDLSNGYSPNEWNFDDEPTRRIEITKEKRKCECGAEKCGSNKHSEYCPKHEKEEKE